MLVIPEDPTQDRYILKPLTEALLKDVGRPAGKVEVLTSPRLRGYSPALTAIRKDLPDRYKHFHLWLFFPDLDRERPDARQDAMRRLEGDLAEQQVKLLCCVAEPEVEIFACVAFLKELLERWKTWDQIRTHPQMKEEVFEPLRKQRGDDRQAGGGRKAMTNASVQSLPLLYRLCPEVKRLRDRIAEHIESVEAR